nr:GGDEF domain-containing protein [Micromonospora sp. DSM 115978]
EQIAHTGTWDWDLATGEVFWSPHLLELLGLPPDSKIDFEAFRVWVHPEDIAAVEETMRRALTDLQPFSYTHRIQRADGTRELVLECNGDVFVDDAGELTKVMVTAHDVTELYETQRELAYLAEHDPLTGLRNRRAMTAALAARFAGPEPASGALLLIDLDNFKDINDRRGHAVGDTVLRAVTQVLSEQLRDAVLGRLGGDEFAVILPAGDGEAANATAEAVCAAVSSRPVIVDGSALRTTVSVGVAGLADAGDGETALARADLALYEAKGAGRDCARLFAPEQYTLAARRVSVEHRVRAALD